MIVLKGKRDELRTIALSDGGRVVVARDEQGTQVWRDLIDRPESMNAHIDRGHFILHPDGTRIISRLGFYNLATDTSIEFDPDPAHGWRALNLSADGQWLLTSTAFDRGHPEPARLECWALESTGMGPLRWRVEIAADWRQHYPIPVADGRFVVPDIRRGQRPNEFLTAFALRSGTTGELLETTAPSTLDGEWFAVSPEGRWVAGARDYRITIWDLTAPTVPPIAWKADTKKSYTAIAFHPSSRFLAAASNDGTVRYFETGTWRVLQTYNWKLGKPKSLAFSPDGALIAAGGDTGRIVIWDVDL